MVNVNNVLRIVIPVQLMVNVLLVKKIVTYLMVPVLLTYLVISHVMNVPALHMINVLNVVKIECYMMESVHVKLDIELMMITQHVYQILKIPYLHQNKYKVD